MREVEDIRRKRDDVRIWQCPSLRFRRDTGCYGSLAHFYGALGTVLGRRRYGQIFGPHRHFPKFANRFYRHPDVRIDLDLHPIWPAAKKHLERGNTLHFVSHTGSLPAGTDWLPGTVRLKLSSAGDKPKTDPASLHVI